MKFAKTMLVAAMFVSAGAANAALTVDTVGGSELYLSVYNADAVNTDGTLGLTFNLDLGITYNQVKTDAAAAFGSGYNLAGNANWTAFTSLITNPSSVKYTVFAGSGLGGILTGNTALVANNDKSVIPAAIGNRLNEHAVEINQGLNGADSSIVKDVPAQPFSGQFTHDVQGLPVAGTFGGWPHDPVASYGSSTNLWFAEAVSREYTDDYGDVVTGLTFLQQDVIKLGTLSLSGNALSYSSGVSQVPLPAAVWMFGAGLMGVLRATRRKSA